MGKVRDMRKAFKEAAVQREGQHEKGNGRNKGSHYFWNVPIRHAARKGVQIRQPK